MLIRYCLISLLLASITLGSTLYAQSPGDTVGWTYYDYQSNGSSGQRIVLDEMSGKHVFWTWTWMNLYPPTVRYNFIDSSGAQQWPYDGTTVALDSRFPQVSGDTADFIGLTYINVNFPNNLWYCYFSMDQNVSECFQPGIDSVYRPFISIDYNGYVHMVYHVYSAFPDLPYRLYYVGSTDGGNTWIENFIDYAECQSAVIASSPVSGKSSIVYAAATVSGSPWYNDIFYLETPDGVTWDWSGGWINVTEYGQDNDSLFAFTDIDALYDFNDNLHVVWNAHWATDQTLYYKTFIFHFDSQSGTISEVSSSDSAWSLNCSPGIWNRPICKMSLGVQQGSNALYTVYTRFDTTDCSAGGYANGDLYMQYSLDDGWSWSVPENITNSSTPDCLPGDCDSDHWSSMAERVDDYLHILYVNDKDAGGAPQSEGTLTLNPMLYLAYPAVTSVIEGDIDLPSVNNLLHAYPNPFNAHTTLEFSLAEPADIELTIYDITGAKVETIYQPGLEAGRHSVVWNASNVASGVYFARMEAGEQSHSIKMVLLK